MKSYLRKRYTRSQVDLIKAQLQAIEIDGEPVFRIAESPKVNGSCIEMTSGGTVGIIEVDIISEDEYRWRKDVQEL